MIIFVLHATYFFFSCSRWECETFRKSSFFHNKYLLEFEGKKSQLMFGLKARSPPDNIDKVTVLNLEKYITCRLRESKNRCQKVHTNK